MRTFKFFCITGILSLLSTMSYAGDAFYVKWDKGSSRSIAAFDVATRGILWEVYPCKTPNFAERTSIGVLTACDDSNVVMLDLQTGKEIWRRDLAIDQTDPRKRDYRPIEEQQINHYHGERPEGFFISVSDETYVVMGKKGEYLMRCGRNGCDRTPPAVRESQTKK